MQTTSVLLLCTGNTCRSPMAGALLQRMHPELKVETAGLSVSRGQPAAPHARQVVAELGGDLSAHAAQAVTHELVEEAGSILCMTDSHRQQLLQKYPWALDKTFTLKSLAGESGDILDPYGSSLADYRACAVELQRLLAAIPVGAARG